MSILKVNTIQDKGGNAIISSDGSGTLTLPSDLKNTPAFGVKRSGSQSIAYNTATLIQWDYEFYDTDNAFDSSTSYAFTVPSGKDGKYFFSAWYRVGTGTNSEGFQMWINKNGSDYKSLGFGSSFNDSYNTTSLTTVLDLVAGDVIKLYAFQNAVNSSFNIAYAGESGFQGFKLIGA